MVKLTTRYVHGRFATLVDTKLGVYHMKFCSSCGDVNNIIWNCQIKTVHKTRLNSLRGRVF